MFVIRTAAGPDTGIGHVIRMSHLARALIGRGQSVLVLLTAPYPAVTGYLDDLDVEYLYPERAGLPEEELGDSPTAQRADARKCLERLAGMAVDRVIVDSYRLGIHWEREVASAGLPLAAFDDLGNRRHAAELIVDARWAGQEATPRRYEGLVPAHARRLLGPAYAVLHPGYAEAGPECPPAVRNILFSLGGGGDLSLISAVIDALLVSLPEDWTVTAVIGPLAYHGDRLRELSRTDRRLQLLESPPQLLEAYRNALLFVGALGTSLYELSALKVPALTFSLAANQDNETKDLEALGHYLHLPRAEFEQAERVAALIRTLLDNLDRLRALRHAAVVQVDGHGTERVVRALLGEPAEPPAAPLGNDNVVSEERLSEQLAIRPVTDRDINHYRESRNLAKNRQNMTITEAIPRVEHYRWWFKTTRESFLLTDSGLPQLYIWHQKAPFDGHEYLIGGWFVCDESVGFDRAAVALEWQLQHTAQTHPDATWIAVINKENRYVNLLNRYMGFTDVDPDSTEHAAIQHFFGKADPEHFNYVKYGPSRD
ncbi:hypothetical protein GM160_03625 [Guyparkeria halophila]|uniref:UDP-2,4-diacetamido-2,4, 6-trideoxy-beta-L-altropyranose hydrolase n=1 Tax=Guyparkeria halophila TaxID=47960 RepID=A0A6I6D1B5_9GAMM|nr:hypothetical protein [Guyparkeria halophila]QGT78055.1 hypothetical protein GM160_03625 [Guyparkeria halophila]